MKKIHIIFSVLMAVSIAACHKDDGDDGRRMDSAQDGEMVFAASATPKSLQKAASNASGTEFVFSPNEKICIYNSSTSNGYEFASGNETASSNAFFVGRMDTDASLAAEFYSVLPYGAAAGRDGSNVLVVLNPEQTATANTFDRSAGIMVSRTSSKTKEFSFKNVCSYARVNVPEPCTAIRLEGNSGEILAGKATVSTESGEFVGVSNGAKYVCISGDIAPGTYYMSLLPAMMSEGFTLTATTKSGTKIVKKISEPVSFDRNVITTVNMTAGCCLLNKAKLKSAVPYQTATKLVFEYKKNVDVSNLTATGKYVDDEENNLQVYCNGTEYYVLSENDGEIIAPEDCSYLCGGDYSSKPSFVSIAFANFNTENVTNMSRMFKYCTSLTSLDVSHFNTDNVTDMGGMFYYCSSLTSLDVSNFNTKNVANLNRMFEGCSSLTSLDLSNFNTENVTDMGWMFDCCSSLTSLDVSNFNTGNVVNMGYMFNDCTSLTSLDVSNFNTDNVTGMCDMFGHCKVLTSLDVSNFNTENVTDMSFMFKYCTSLTSLDVSHFKTENVMFMNAMFEGCSSLTSLDVSNFNTDNVTRMESMFRGCSSLTNLDVSNFNTEKVTDMSLMFYDCTSLTSLDVSNFNTENVTDMGGMFGYCKVLTSLDVSHFNTENVTDMGWMFCGCSSLTSLDVSNFNTENVTDMGNMFAYCSSLKSLDVSNFNTEKVKDMRGMFRDCSSLTNLDVSNFNTENVSDMIWMFLKCNNLKTVYVSKDFQYEQAEIVNMFENCPATGNYGPNNQLTLVQAPQ